MGYSDTDKIKYFMNMKQNSPEGSYSHRRATKRLKELSGKALKKGSAVQKNNKNKKTSLPFSLGKFNPVNVHRRSSENDRINNEFNGWKHEIYYGIKRSETDLKKANVIRDGLIKMRSYQGDPNIDQKELKQVINYLETNKKKLPKITKKVFGW